MAKGKSFKANMEETKSNAALAFITQPQEVETKEQEKETKSKRVNLLVKPSVYEALTKVAAMKRTSVNDLLNTIAAEYAASNAQLIEKYDRTFAEE